MERFDNWMSYSFDNGIINGAKPAIDSTFKLHFNKDYKPKQLSYYDALFHNARMMKDSYSEMALFLCFDSQLRAYLPVATN